VIQRLPSLSSGEHGYSDSSRLDSARTGTSRDISSAEFDLYLCPMAPGGIRTRWRDSSKSWHGFVTSMGWRPLHLTCGI